MTSTNDVMISNHTFGSIFGDHGWAGFYWPMLITLFALLIVFFLGK